MMYALRPLAVASLLALAACGEPLATGDYKPPYFIIHGTITGSSVATPPNVRIALLWQNDQNPGVNYAAQDVDVAASFPVSFEVKVTEAPTAGVIHALKPDTAVLAGLDPNMRWAFASLVAYADDNSNGELDVVPPGDSPPDRILGATSDLDIIYLSAGQPAPAEWIGLLPVSPGFSLVREPPRRMPNPGECGWFTPQGHFTDRCSAKSDALPTPIDPSSVVELTLTGDPALAHFACNAYWGPFEYADWLNSDATETCDGGVCKYCRGYQCPPDLPPARVEYFQCSADNTSYVYKTCVTDAALCDTRFCHFGHGERAAADPPPANWPCP
jgi:hypothetical protein